MGRGAGNAETELMLACDTEKRKNIKGFHLNNLLEELKKLKDKLDWGSSFAMHLLQKWVLPSFYDGSYTKED